MKKIIEYQIVSAVSMTYLCNKVNEEIKKYWSPFEEMIIHEHNGELTFIQVMVKYQYS